MGSVQVIGTSHIAQESVKAVREKILTEKPDLVTIELDAARFYDLMSPHKKQRRVRLRDISKIGLFGWLFAVIGAFVQKRLGKQTGAKPGSDMKSAVLAARKAGSQIVLIDRSIAETVNRLSKNVPLREKWGLVWFLFFGWIFEKNEMKKLSNFDLKKVPSSRVIHQLVEDFKHRFPNMHKVLVTERDDYMVTRIKLLEKRFPDANILVVIGAGHEEGMKKLLKDNKK